MNLEWKAPPPAKRGRTATKWAEVAAQLRANPNTWALVGIIHHQSQASIVSKTYGLKCVTRKLGDKEFEMYAMHEEGQS